MGASSEEPRQTLADAFAERDRIENPARENVWLALLWLVAGVLAVLACVRVLGAGASTVLNSHPASIVIWFATALIGVVAVGWGGATCVAAVRRPTRKPDRDRGLRRRWRRWWVTASAISLVLVLLLAGAVAWSKPMPAEPVAVAALVSDDEVQVQDRLLWYELAPTPPPNGPLDKEPTPKEEEQEEAPKVGLIFTPGARVDPRAYAAMLRPLAADGHLVVVLKKPLGLAVLSPDPPASVLDGHSEITHWVVGGHSLGGTVAASFADQEPRVSGLVLLASWPARTMERQDLPVLSVTAGNDGLATPEKIAETRDRLPAGTTFHDVPGAVHADFGDYGEQPGDGDRGVDKTTAQEEIRTVLSKFVAGIG